MEITARPRVLHLLTSLGAGGAETNLLALIREFDNDAFEHVVAFGGCDGVLEPEFRRAGVRLVKLHDKPLGAFSFFSLRKMLSTIESVSPDILHSHLDLSNLVGLAAKKRTGKPLLLHFHGFGIIPSRLLPGKSGMYKFWNMVSHLYRYCDKAIAICRFQFPFLRKAGISDDKVVLIPNGISLKNERVPKDKHAGPYRFISVGRFFPQKDHGLLIRSFGQVAARNSNVRLTLVGEGPLRKDVERQVEECGLQDRVEFLGLRRDIPELLADSDCFVLSSSWELHPITILEAMDAALPVISTDVGGIPDTVVDGSTGVLLKPGDQDALVQAMQSLASDRDKSLEMGSNGKELVRRKFNNEVVAREIENVYRDMLRSNQSSYQVSIK